MGEAVQFAFTDNLSWAVDVRGVPYPPFGGEELGYGDLNTLDNIGLSGGSGVYVRRNELSGFDRRSSVTDPSVSKTVRAYGNSIAVVAQEDIDKILNANFNYSPKEPLPEEEIQFTDQSTALGTTIDSYEYNFGDTNTSTNPDPTHHYEEVGEYEVRLNITDTEGSWDTVNKTIQIGVENNAVHEGGDNTQTLKWGTNGSRTIAAPPADGFGDTGELCIGNKCQKSQDNQPIQTEDTPGNYTNRDLGVVNGTVTVTQNVTWPSGETLCIGEMSNEENTCGQKDGLEKYGDDFYVPADKEGRDDGPLDGPLDMVSERDTYPGNPAVRTDQNTCWGSNC